MLGCAPPALSHLAAGWVTTHNPIRLGHKHSRPDLSDAGKAMKNKDDPDQAGVKTKRTPKRFGVSYGITRSYTLPT